MSTPSITTDPDPGRYERSIILTAVLLPLPVGPIIASVPPFDTLNDTSSRAGTGDPG